MGDATPNNEAEEKMPCNSAVVAQNEPTPQTRPFPNCPCQEIQFKNCKLVESFFVKTTFVLLFVQKENYRT